MSSFAYWLAKSVYVSFSLVCALIFLVALFWYGTWFYEAVDKRLTKDFAKWRYQDAVLSIFPPEEKENLSLVPRGSRESLTGGIAHEFESYFQATLKGDRICDLLAKNSQALSLSGNGICYYLSSPEPNSRAYIYVLKDRMFIDYVPEVAS